MIFLQTDRLILRNYRLSDIPEIYPYFSSEEVARYEDFDPLDMQELTELVGEWKDMDNRMVAVKKETGEIVGSVGYWVDEDKNYSVDFDFNPKFWHNGFAFESASEVVRFLRDDLQIKNIFGDCDERNIPAKHLFEKLGFHLVMIDKEGAYKDDKNGKPITVTINVYKLDV